MADWVPRAARTTVVVAAGRGRVRSAPRRRRQWTRLRAAQPVAHAANSVLQPHTRGRWGGGATVAAVPAPAGAPPLGEGNAVCVPARASPARAPRTTPRASRRPARPPLAPRWGVGPVVQRRDHRRGRHAPPRLVRACANQAGPCATRLSSARPARDKCAPDGVLSRAVVRDESDRCRSNA